MVYSAVPFLPFTLTASTAVASFTWEMIKDQKISSIKVYSSSERESLFLLPSALTASLALQVRWDEYIREHPISCPWSCPASVIQCILLSSHVCCTHPVWICSVTSFFCRKPLHHSRFPEEFICWKRIFPEKAFLSTFLVETTALGQHTVWKAFQTLSV